MPSRDCANHVKALLPYKDFVFSSRKLVTKLATISGAFLLVAFIAIGLTLVESWNLEGAGAAINALGSERMRSYHIAFLLEQGQLQELDREIAQFEDTLRLIRLGDPRRPLYLPKSETVYAHMDKIAQEWSDEILPAIASIRSADVSHKAMLIADFSNRLDTFVTRIDALVSILERHSDNNLSALRTLQIGLLVLALLGTFVLMGLLYLVVVRPIISLRDGMRRMQAEDFNVRVPMRSMDEIGDLAIGFNSMVSHLQQLYDTLELRVVEKTHSLEAHRDELKTLYETTALLAHAPNLEEMCRTFLQQLMSKYNADGGMLRLTDRNQGKMHLFVHEGLPPTLVTAEQCKGMGECFCGEVAAHPYPTVHLIDASDHSRYEYGCNREGFGAVLALPVLWHDRSLGLCNLFFKENRVIAPQQRKLLETLAQHLGAAIESSRIVAAEKELAISSERNIIAQELHDRIAQSLAFLNLQTQMLENAIARNDSAQVSDDLQRIRTGVQESYEDVRELLVHFRSRVSESDLETELARTLTKFESQTGIKTSLIQYGHALPLPPEQQAQVLYIVQEALSNVRKHAHATLAEVIVRRGEDYKFSIRDDGCGIDVDTISQGNEGIGMSIMRERVERIGGSVEIKSYPGHGTKVQLRVPTIAERNLE
ncbi:two-component system, NarL family, nitrate/nitrite sensor histidine kinase NarX [Novimethylophilus kurashikiensis]|uniref:Sensor protein n=1 Tax=Novimethylophilus kurashikiensis TaxID=1825523 RepID=A0A2R5FEW1_9PROT|nr:ATP-binding protein [Novimethylophilus kurashikiensis]GBG14934.1 two-component system, NarL family, nitrate/nitrite sensor histidine kinase NarX [Novimethylophilus kurashikiensis]